MSTAFARDAELLRSLVHRIDPSDSGAFNNLGVLYHTKGLHAEAVDAFMRALRIDPRMRTAVRNLEIAAAVPGACDTRLAELGARIAHDPDDVDARREEARLLRLVGQIDEALRRFDSLIAEFPDDAASLLERGLLERRSGDLRRAQRWLERARNAAPHDGMIRLCLAEVFYHRGANEQALNLLDDLVADEPGHAEAHLLRSFVLGDVGRHEAAAAAVQLANSLDPSLATLQPNLSIEKDTSPLPVAVAEGTELARYGLALAFRQRGYFDGARRELQRAREAGEDERLVSHALAELDLVAGASQTALDVYTTLLSQHGDHARYWCEHGVALHQLGRLPEAAASYRKALRVDPRYAFAYNNLAVALEQQGDYAAAREALQRAVELDATLVRARINLARWYVGHNEALAALALLRELTSFQTDNAEAFSELGRVLFTLSRFAEARQALARAVELDGASAAARYTLADTLAALGDNDGAARETENALGLSPLRPETRLQLGIELQRECPDATASIDLLMFTAASPLEGAVVSHDELEAMLPEAPSHHGARTVGDQSGGELEKAFAACAEADAFAERGLHGEAQERYERSWRLLGVHTQQSGAEGESLARRAMIGDARSRCLLSRGHEAVEQLRSLDEADGADEELLAVLAAAEAQHAVAAGEAAVRAEAVMSRLLQLVPESAALLHFVGDAAQRIGHHQYAMVFYRRALTADPARPTPRVAIARMLRKRGETLAAQLELVAALAAHPRLRDARLELARVHVQRHRAADALALVTLMLEENPTDVEALVLLGESLLRAERFADARIALAHARRYAPDDAHALHVEAEILARQGRIREARERWERIVSAHADCEFADHARSALAEPPAHAAFTDTPAFAARAGAA